MENSKIQDDIIQQMNEVISLQDQEINFLKELNYRLQEQNELLQKHNKEIFNTFHRMINHP